MKSKYLYRALSEGDLEMIYTSGNLFKGRMITGENLSAESYINEHIYGCRSNDGIISLTSSLAVALNYANNTKNKSENKGYTDIMVVDCDKIDEKNLCNLSTNTLYIEHSKTYQADEFQDTRHDTLTEKSKEYLYFGGIPKEAIRVLPRWFVEILYLIRNTNGGKTAEKEQENNRHILKRTCSHESFVNAYADNLNKLIYLYCNDNYSNIDDLIEKNERLINITDFGYPYSKEDFKNKDSILHKQFSILLNDIEMKGHDTIVARSVIEKLLDASSNMDVFCSNIQEKIEHCSSLEKVFIYEYYYNKKSLEELKKLFINQNFLIEENISDRDISLIIESLRCITLAKIKGLLISLEEKLLSKKNKECLTGYNSKFKNTYILKTDDTYLFPINYSGHLNSFTVDHYNYDLRIAEHISIKKDEIIRDILKFNYKLEENTLKIKEDKKEVYFNFNDKLINDYYSKIDKNHIASLFEYKFK